MLDGGTNKWYFVLPSETIISLSIAVREWNSKKSTSSWYSNTPKTTRII